MVGDVLNWLHLMSEQKIQIVNISHNMVLLTIKMKKRVLIFPDSKMSNLKNLLSKSVALSFVVTNKISYLKIIIL